RWVVPAVLAALALIVAVVLIAGGSSKDEKASNDTATATTTATTETTPTETDADPADGKPKADFSGTGYPNGDLRNTRRVGGPITAKTAKNLKLAWSRPIDGSGNYGS